MKKITIQIYITAIAILGLPIIKSFGQCPDPIITSVAQNVCRGATITVSGSFTGSTPYSAILIENGGTGTTEYARINGLTSSTFNLIYTTNDNSPSQYDVKILSSGCNGGETFTDPFSPYSFNFNPTPNSYTVTTAGSFCEIQQGYPIGIVNSQSLAKYSLFRNGIFVSSIQGLNGNPRTFTNQTIVGIYSISGIFSNGCRRDMNGTLTIKPIPSVPTYTFSACGSNLISVKGSSTTTAAGIIWSRSLPFNAIEVITTTNNAIYTYPSSVSGIQYFNVKATLNGCESAATPNFSVTHILNPNPILNGIINTCNYGGSAGMGYTISGLSGNGPWAVSITGPGAGLITIPAGNFSYNGTFYANVLGNITYSIVSIKVDETVCLTTSPSSVTYNVKQWPNPYIFASGNGIDLFLNVSSVSGASYQWYYSKPNIDGTGATAISGATNYNFTTSLSSVNAPNNIRAIRIVNAHCISTGAYNCTDGTRFRIGDDEISLSNELMIYPNPAQNSITIQAPFENYSVTITNLLGETLIANNSTLATSTLEVSSLASGSYIVTLNNGKETITKALKIVK